MPAHTLSCHCNAVSLKVSGPPEYINYCNCSLCRSTGAKWGYFKRSDVRIAGLTSEYVRDDIAQPAIVTHFCPACGATTHWDDIKQRNSGVQADYRMGVNVALMDPTDLSGIEIRHFNGMRWNGTWREKRVLGPDDQF